MGTKKEITISYGNKSRMIVSIYNRERRQECEECVEVLPDTLSVMVKTKEL
jgi:hypothetical protein